MKSIALILATALSLPAVAQTRQGPDDSVTANPSIRMNRPTRLAPDDQIQDMPIVRRTGSNGPAAPLVLAAPAKGAAPDPVLIDLFFVFLRAY